MKNKNGITLVVLIATIAIAIILLSVSIVAIGNTIRNSNLLSFKDELTKVYQEVTRYYTLSGDFPKLTDEKILYSDISDMSSDSETFEAELELNNDTNSYFMKIDLSKLNFDRTVRGTLRNSKDIFVVAYPTFNIYYLDGYKEGNDIYFSLANLGTNEKITSEDANIVSVTQSGDLRVKKLTNNWTNLLNIQVTTYMEEGETLKASIPVDNDGNYAEATISTTTSITNDIKLTTLNSIGFSQSQIYNFNILEQSKKTITITKTLNGNKTGEVVVDLYNYDAINPITTNCTYTSSSNPEYNEITLSGLQDSLSGIKTVKYVYYSKIEAGNTVLYSQDANVYTPSYIKENGNEAKIVNGNAVLKVPKGVTLVKYVAIDNADNASSVSEINTKTTVFIDYKTISGTNTSITFKVGLNTSSAISECYSEFSLNGEDYVSKYNYNVSNVTNGNLHEHTYTDIINLRDFIYIKITAKTTSNNIETRIIKVSTSNFETEGTRIKTEARWDNPYIPEGFIHTTGNVLTGFVIQDVTDTDNKYNEFVWIPVNYIKTAVNSTYVANPKTLSTLDSFVTNWKIQSSISKSTIDTTALSSSYVQKYDSTDLTEYEAIVSSINTYGGFYVARYEAGSLEVRDSNSSDISSAVVRKDAYPYNYIKIATSMSNLTSGAIYVCRNMYNNLDVKSNLIYGFEWDAMMYFISLLNKNVSDSSSIANYTSVTNTGINESYVTGNIYDVAGNLEEWTMEMYGSTKRVIRGGNSSYKGAGYRNISYSITSKLQNVGFRPALYII